MLIRQFIKLLESGKYKIEVNNFLDCKGFKKIIKNMFKNSRKYYEYEHLFDVFKDTDMSNVGYKFGGNWRLEIPFILPKHDTRLSAPIAFPDYIEKYGLKSFISVLKKAFQ